MGLVGLVGLVRLVGSEAALVVLHGLQFGILDLVRSAVRGGIQP